MKTTKEKNNNQIPFWKNIKLLIVLVVLLILFSFLSPLIFTSFSTGFNFTETGAIGDTIGGLMNPFIAIASVIVTYLAFKMQFDANKTLKDELEAQKNETKKQQIERQFYEMLKLYKENVNEISINLYKEDNSPEEINKFKPQAFFNRTTLVIDTELKGRFSYISFINEIGSIYYHINSSLNVFFESENEPNSKYNLKIAYEIFFNGINKFKIIEPVLFKNFENYFDDINLDSKITLRNEYGLNRKLYIGGSPELGHYFRHLYQTVKFIASNKVLNEEEKINYLKILRSQISNNEQVLLFYNYIGGPGKNWENENQKYFSQYKMIHNIDNSMLFEGIKLEDFFDEEMKKNKDMFDFQNTNKIT